MTSSGTRTPTRSSYNAWNALSTDLLVIVAKNCDAVSVCRLSQACKAWRDAVAREPNSSSIWEPLVSKRFPRSLDILKALPSLPKYSFVEHYREQLKAESSIAEPKPPSVTTQLSDFVFTAELVSTSESRRIVDAWTGVAEGVLSERSGADASFLLPIAWHGRPLRLELFVSRAFNGRIRTRKLFASDADTLPVVFIDGIWKLFASDSKPIPLSKSYSAEFDVERVAISLEIPDSESPPSSISDSESVLMQFESSTDEDFDPMDVHAVLEYLEHGVDWE